MFEPIIGITYVVPQVDHRRQIVERISVLMTFPIQKIL